MHTLGDDSESRNTDRATSLRCLRCFHEWSPRGNGKLPKSCPSCRSTIWMKGSHRRNCKRCHHEWESTDDSPKRCPACGTYRWDDAPTVHECNKCHYSWNAKREWPPKRCPNCRSTRWAISPTGIREKEEKAAKRPSAVKLNEKRSESIIRYYREGQTCTKISLKTGIPFNIVYEIVLEHTAPELPKI